MKHSIYTVLNSAYMTFGKIFIQSYFEYNLDKCNYFFILNAGLKEHDIKWLSQFDKIQIIGSDVNTNFKNGNTSDDWTKTVVAKTYGLREILKSYDVTPIIMIDSDCLVLQEISSLINMDVSINKSNLDFMDKWINTIPTISTPWKESPALSKIYLEYKDKLEIGLIPEQIVSCYDKETITPDVRIVHFKSGAAHKTIEESIQKRIYERGFGEEVKKYV